MFTNETEYQTLVYQLLYIVALLLLLVAVVRFAMFLDDFFRELRYINIEIGRTRGEEKKYWQARKRKLWRSLIPFVKY